jgi:hypothetical protein
MNAKKFAASSVVSIAIAAWAPVVLAHDEGLEGEHPETSPGLVRDVRQVTERYRDVSAATAAGYVSTRSCASGPNGGAMGVHYVNEAYISDGALDVQRPEVLVYEPDGGHLRLVAVEFLVDAEQWNAANTAPPVLGGQLFNYVGTPNRLRMPAYYELHVWAWNRNPSGIFSDWNPHVSCTAYVGEAAAAGTGQ